MSKINWSLGTRSNANFNDEILLLFLLLLLLLLLLRMIHKIEKHEVDRGKTKISRELKEVAELMQ